MHQKDRICGSWSSGSFRHMFGIIHAVASMCLDFVTIEDEKG